MNEDDIVKCNVEEQNEKEIIESAENLVNTLETYH